MLNRLQELENNDTPIRVALVGAGSMGLGIARQVGKTPGMRLSYVADLDSDAAQTAATASGQVVCKLDGAAMQPIDPSVCLFSDEPLRGLEDLSVKFDVLVEATNAIGWAARYCRTAIKRSAHVVLMNAEVDLALGPLLQHEARQSCVQVTSDGGDQHGVLKRMIDDISLWGFRVVQAGNIKGFLDRHATAEMLVEEAAKRHLNPVQCCAYTDGTKLNIEMALVANGTGLMPSVPGMEGPACDDVHDVMHLFDFDSYDQHGCVDYILGAEPGGGVYVVGHCNDPLQMQYLDYYKMGEGPYYLFYRPYHLCHLETPKVIAEAMLEHKALLKPIGLATDVFAYAKRKILPGTKIGHGIGGEEVYGLIENNDKARDSEHVPISLLEPEGKSRARFLKTLEIDQPVTWDAIEIPETYLLQCWREQNKLL